MVLVVVQEYLVPFGEVCSRLLRLTLGRGSVVSCCYSPFFSYSFLAASKPTDKEEQCDDFGESR